MPRRTHVRLTDPGALLSSAHILDSGLPVRLRLTRPSDGRYLDRFLREVSEDSLESRFGHAEPDREEIRELTFYDPRERLVIAAATLDGSSESFVGVADVTLLETGLAEIGVLVTDRHQASGIGRLLSECIAHMARDRGATHVRATMPRANPAMLSLMERLGPTIKTVEREGLAAYTRLPVVRRRAA